MLLAALILSALCAVVASDEHTGRVTVRRRRKGRVDRLPSGTRGKS